MIYSSPIDTKGVPYHVPLVVKNVDYLRGFISGAELTRGIVSDILTNSDILIDIPSVTGMLDSSRFNDLLDNDVRQRDMSADDMREYFLDLIQDINVNNDKSISENVVNYNNVLDIECNCGYGFYSWNDVSTLPDTNFSCTNCGRLLIEYTEVDDFNIEYDGGSND